MKARRAVWRLGAAFAIALLMTGCELAPVYRPPQMILPASYQGDGPFVKADPSEQLQHGPWWRMYGDAQLDALESQLDAANPDLASAVQTYVQARDAVGEARAGLFPQLGLAAGVSENKESVHTLFRHTDGSLEQASNQYAAALAWQPDFWSQTRNMTRAAMSDAQATAAQVASARLGLEMELAADYAQVRGLDDEHAVLGRAIGFYQTAAQITRMRLADKIAAGLDVARAENQLATAQVADTDVLARREVLEHAIAVLAGKNPADFRLPPQPAPRMAVPQIPPGVPSSLLQRRPDIAAAERTMAAANAQIGVARAAFYPNVRLSAVGGFEDSGFGLASLPDSLWSVGASAMLPLFEGGLRHAQVQASWSRFTQTGDQYRATVLQAFQQVEDNLVLSGRLADEEHQQDDALRSALKVQKLAMQLYEDGIDNYLNVTVAQIAALDAQVAQVELHTRRVEASIGLIGALGGGWHNTDLPLPEQTLPSANNSVARNTAAPNVQVTSR
ncbi:efflux transporter outer membrane subunit [Paraburkholderia jirisanensis]